MDSMTSTQQINGSSLAEDNTSSITQGYNWILSESIINITNINTIVYYSILIPVALIGNILTLSAVIMVLRVKKSIPNMLIGVLALADLMSLFTVHSLSIASMVSGHWIGNDSLCRFQSVMSYSYFKLGFFSKTNVSIDRFIALKFPLKYRTIVTTKKVASLVIFNVIFSIGSSALTWVIDPEYIIHLPTWYMCANDFSIFSTYKLSIVVIEGGVFMLGVIIFFIGNITLIRVMLKLNKKRIRRDGYNIKSINSITPPMTAGVGIASNADSVSITDIKLEPDNQSTGQTQGILRRFESDLSEIDSKDAAEYDDDGSKRESVDIVSTTPEINGNDGSTKRRYVVNPHVKDANRKCLSLPTYTKLPDDNHIGSEVIKNGYRSSTIGLLQRVFNISSPVRNVKNKKQRQQQKELQFAKLVMVIVTVFVILWIPLMVTIFYEHVRRERLHPVIIDISMKLVFANACINPILYGVFNANFRKAYFYYMKILAFHVTCKMTKRPSEQDLRKISTLSVIPTKTQYTEGMSRSTSYSFSDILDCKTHADRHVKPFPFIIVNKQDFNNMSATSKVKWSLLVM